MASLFSFSMATTTRREEADGQINKDSLPLAKIPIRRPRRQGRREEKAILVFVDWTESQGERKRELAHSPSLFDPFLGGWARLWMALICALGSTCLLPFAFAFASQPHHLPTFHWLSHKTNCTHRHYHRQNVLSYRKKVSENFSRNNKPTKIILVYLFYFIDLKKCGLSFEISIFRR